MLTFSLDSGAPPGANITAAGAFTWVPTEAQGPGVYPVTVRVTDSGAPPLSDSETIMITVTETNEAPVLAPIGHKIVDEGALVTFTASATDSDEPAQMLTYSLAPGAPAAASINATNGVFNWLTSEIDGPGVYTVTVRVTDDGAPPRSNSETLTITVNEINEAPALAGIGNRMVVSGGTLTFDAVASDADLPAQRLTFSLVSAPPGATINATNGAFAWTAPSVTAPATNRVTVAVSDSGTPALTDSETFNVVVVPAPRFIAITLDGAGQVTLVWRALPGKTYRVLWSSNVTAGPWTPLGGDVTASGPVAMKTDSIQPGQQRFYQVMLLE
jgi:PKD repeat protein